MILEEELEHYIFRHKSTILLTALLAYYTDKQKDEVNIPEFLDISIEEKAQRHFLALLANKEEFNKAYEACWDRFREVLP